MTNTKAQVGDLIRIVNHCGIGSYNLGDIFEVIERHESDTRTESGVYVSGHGVYIFDREYEIHLKAGEEGSFNVDGLKSRASTARGLGVSEQERLGMLAAVNSPNHYTQGRFETIEVIEEITSGYNDGYVAYCVGNALKYEARAPFKHDNPLEDLRKAARYLAYAIDYLDAKSTQ